MVGVVKTVQRMLCRHQYAWVERRGREVCLKCGHAKAREIRT